MLRSQGDDLSQNGIAILATISSTHYILALHKFQAKKQEILPANSTSSVCIASPLPLSKVFDQCLQKLVLFTFQETNLAKQR